MATACSTSFGISWKQIDGLLSSVIKGSTRSASVVSYQLVTQDLCETDYTIGENILIHFKFYNDQNQEKKRS